MKRYRKEQLKDGWFQMVQQHYGRKIFCLPRLHLLKERAYRKRFPIGKAFHIGFGTRFYHEPGRVGELRFGDFCTVTNHVMLDYSGDLLIGDHVLISERTMIYTHNYDYRAEDKVIPDGVTIKDHVWIAAGSMILPGVTIGEHSVVGAGSVVTHDVPPWTMVAGNPAVIVKKLGPPQEDKGPAE